MFASADSALKWAARIKCVELYKSSAINRMCGKPERSTQNDLLIGLSPDETRKQADNIYGLVTGISDPVSENYLLAKYFYEDDITRLMSRVHISMTDRSRDLTMLIKAYLGRKVTHRMMRDALCCSNNQVATYKQMVFDLMDKIHYQAIDQVDREMVNAGLIYHEKIA